MPKKPQTAEPGRMPRKFAEGEKRSNDLYEGFPILACLSVSIILLGFLILLALHIYIWYKQRTADVKYTKMEARLPCSSSPSADKQKVEYKLINTAFDVSWEESGDDAILFLGHDHQSQNYVTTKDESQHQKERPIVIEKSDNQTSACFKSKGSDISEFQFYTKRGLQPDTENANGLREGEDSIHQNRGHGHTNTRQIDSQDVTNPTWQRSLPNMNKTNDIEGAQTELNQRLGNLKGGYANTGQKVWKLVPENSGCNSELTDEEVLAKYRERNQYRRWSQPVWKMDMRGSKREGPGSKWISPYREFSERDLDNDRRDEYENSSYGDGEETSNRNLNLTTGKRSERTDKIPITVINDCINVHSGENTTERFGLRMKRYEIEDMTKPSTELWQQWSIDERKSNEAERLRSDDNLSRYGQLREKHNMELEMRPRTLKNGDDSIIYFDFKSDSRQTVSDSGTYSELLRPTSEPSDNTESGCQRFLVDYVDDDDIEYELLSDHSRYSGTENSRDALTKKTDEMLKALMINTFGSNYSTDNTKLLFRSYSDSELVKERSSLMRDRLSGHYNFSTSNLRSRQIQINQVTADYSKNMRRKKGRKGISMRLKDLKKLLGLKKKKKA